MFTLIAPKRLGLFWSPRKNDIAGLWANPCSQAMRQCGCCGASVARNASNMLGVEVACDAIFDPICLSLNCRDSRQNRLMP